MTETGENAALPQSITNDRVSNKICYVYIMKKHLCLVHNRISPAVVAVIATIASVQFFFPGPILDLLIPTDRLVQHLAHTHNLDAHTSMTTGQLPDRVHPTGSETKYHVFNNQKLIMSIFITAKPRRLNQKRVL